MSSLKLILLVCLVGATVLTASAHGGRTSGGRRRSGWGFDWSGGRRRWYRPDAKCICNMTTPAGTTSHPQTTRIDCTMPSADKLTACREACQAFLNKTQADSNRGPVRSWWDIFRPRWKRWATWGWWDCYGSRKICRDNNNNSTLRADISFWIKSDVEGCATPAAPVGTAVINCTRSTGTSRPGTPNPPAAPTPPSATNPPAPPLPSVNTDCTCMFSAGGNTHNETMSREGTPCSQMDEICVHHCRAFRETLDDSPQSSLARTMCCFEPGATSVTVSTTATWRIRGGAKCSNSPRPFDSSNVKCPTGNGNCDP